jgi:hypothetical protein
VLDSGFYDRHPLFWGRLSTTPVSNDQCTFGAAFPSCFGNEDSFLVADLTAGKIGLGPLEKAVGPPLWRRPALGRYQPPKPLEPTNPFLVP